VVHQPVSRGFAVFADAWLSDWLAEISADLRETVAHYLEVVLHDDALYKSTYFTFSLVLVSMFRMIVSSMIPSLLLVPLSSTLLHLRCDVGLEEGQY